MEIGITSITRVATVARLDVAQTGGPAKAGNTRAAAAGRVSTGPTAPLAPRVHDEPLTRDQVRDLRKRIRAVDHAVRDAVADRREHDHEQTAAPSERGNVREIRHLAREFRHDLRVLARTARHAEHVLSALNGSLQRFVNGAGAVAGAGTETETPAPAPVHDEPLPVHDEPRPAPPAAPAAQQRDIDPQIVKIANSVFELLKFVKNTLLPEETSTPAAPNAFQALKRASTAFQVPPVVGVGTAETPNAPVAVQPQQAQPTATQQQEQAEVDPQLQKIANSVFELLKFVKQTLLPNNQESTEPAAASASFTRIAVHIDLLA